MTGADTGGEFAGVGGVLIFDDSVKDADGDEPEADIFGDLGGSCDDLLHT